MEQMRIPHKLTLNDRKSLSISGVTEVVGFDEESVILKIGESVLHVQGEGLRLKALSPEGGQVAVDGHIHAMVYQEGRVRGGFWSRLWG